ncbi:MAG: hypothetical protein P1V20_16270 [Verrucomicrobiales bacterium]|nr:hypothetical protein [Verrucomicrobiales bacterium]
MDQTEIELDQKEKIKQLRSNLSEYYILWIRLQNSRPSSLDVFLSGKGGPKTGNFCLQDLDLNLPEEFAQICTPGSADHEYEDLSRDALEHRKENFRKLGLSFLTLDCEKPVAELSKSLQNLLADFNQIPDGTDCTIEDATDMLRRTLREAMRLAAAVLAEAVELIETSNFWNHRRRWFLFRGIKGVFFYYVKPVLRWGIKEKVLPDRAPSKHIQKIVFQGFNFGGLLEKFCISEEVRQSVKNVDPADPVKAYAEMLWHGVLLILGFHLFPGNSFPIKSENTFDNETGDFVNEVFDFYFYFIAKTPADSSLNIAKLLKRRFIDV